jgi:septal ring factor EnvC (AmiA/AmiB activator)
MKILFYLFLASSLLLATSIDGKIKKSKKELSAKRVEYQKMNKELSKVAKKILTAKANQEKLNTKLSSLEKKIKSDEESYNQLTKESSEITENLDNVTKEIDTKQLKFVELISKNFSMALALEELNTPTSESVMTKEVYSVYSKKNSEDIERLNKDLVYLNSKKKSLTSKQLNIKKTIGTYINERKEYKDKNQEQNKLLKELQRDKAIYKKRFNRIKASRKKLERKLASLKIIKSDARKEANRKEANRKEANRKESNKKTSKTSTKHTEVPTVSSSRIIKYSASKTISPLKGARLIKKFGTYTDPIYKFKIFNKSITLKAPHSGSKVRTVLKGKVVFAENSGGMLGKVVIVEHSNGIHTIYAKLSRLAPGISVGKRLSKGAIIGKVDKSLMFEVTKDNKHMNPLNLIRL